MVSGDMIVGIILADSPPTSADDDHDFTLVVELLRLRWAQQVIAVSGQGIRCTHEQAWLRRIVGTVLVLSISIGVIHADTGYFLRAGNGRQVGDLAFSDISGQVGCQGPGFFEPIAGQSAFQIAAHPGTQVNDAVTGDSAPARVLFMYE